MLFIAEISLTFERRTLRSHGEKRRRVEHSPNAPLLEHIRHELYRSFSTPVNGKLFSSRESRIETPRNSRHNSCERQQVEQASKKPYPNSTPMLAGISLGEDKSPFRTSPKSLHGQRPRVD